MKSGNKKSILAVIMMSVMLLAFGAACGDTKASEKEYVSWYESNRSDLEDAMLTYAKRMMEADPTDDQWAKNVKKSLDDLQKVVDDVKAKKNAPAAYKKAHEHLVKASEGYQYLIDETPKTIKTIDENTVDGLNVIEHRLDKALEETKKADDEVEKVASDSKNDKK
ncbi:MULTISPECIES: hypothetical protein [Bacillus]|uniref:hypothetical protein n=1 Tax=Bacillus TaxID=1386 RepID=UPI000DBBFD4F|nr:hypothetical protein [Bacillus altitudinis]UJM27084.1 hypothetical protein L2D31_15625 [Bacillus aerophilus]SPR92257.1 conserved exported hypothetical protein [Bacillus altitudinis]